MSGLPRGKLRSLDLSGNMLRLMSFLEFLESFQATTHIATVQMLDLSDNQLGIADDVLQCSIESKLRALLGGTSWNQWEPLRLASNQLGASAVLLAKAACRVHTLELGSNAGGMDGVKALAAMLDEEATDRNRHVVHVAMAANRHV